MKRKTKCKIIRLFSLIFCSATYVFIGVDKKNDIIAWVDEMVVDEKNRNQIKQLIDDIATRRIK